MKNRIILISLLLVMAAFLFAQYDEKAIMSQNAQQLFFQRQYVQAEQAWLQILQKYPNDISAITQLFQLYVQINQLEKAEKLLQDYRAVLPDNIRTEYEIQLYINQAKVTDAWDKAQAYIQLSPKDENRYRMLAGYFERKGFYEQAIRLYEQGRLAIGNSNLFCMEVGNSAYNSHIYDKAMTEYIKFLEAQPGNLFFVSNQLKNILTDNPELITQLKGLAKISVSLEVKEAYAISLSRMGKLKEALSEYELLPTEKLYAFANEQYANGKDSLAIIAYNSLRNRQPDVNTQGEIYIKLGELYTRLRQFAMADSILSNIVDTSNNKVNSIFERRKYALQAFLMLADLAQWQGKDIVSITKLYEDARKYAYQKDDLLEIDYRQIDTYYINDLTSQAEQLLLSQNKNKQPDRFLYYSYLIAMAKLQPEKADSLLNDLIVLAPSSKYVNDLMTINILLMNLSKSTQGSFYQAYRLKLSHRDSLAVQTLSELSKTAKDEELRIVAADWAFSSGLKTMADSLYSFEWQDAILKEYASLQRSKLQNESGKAETMAQDFLKSNPNSVFSPSFRQILQKAPAGRPSL
jgi:hypothetical protein